jgi:hypothetical protein
MFEATRMPAGAPTSNPAMTGPEGPRPADQRGPAHRGGPRAAVARRPRNLILIGGPDGNRVTGEVITRTGGTLSLVSPDGEPPFVLDSANGKQYRPERLQDRGSFSDYGLVVLAPNPFNPKTHVLVVAGLYGYGSWAGARLVTQEDFARNDLVVSGTPFEAMFTVDVVDQTPQHVSLMTMRPLSAKRPSPENEYRL